MIALIEDSDTDFILFQKFIGISVTRYEKINDFLDNKENYKKVILDLSLPDGFGFDTIERVRNEFKGKIFVLSGMGGYYLKFTTIEKLKDHGADAVFQKHKLSDEKYCDEIRKVINENS